MSSSEKYILQIESPHGKETHVWDSKKPYPLDSKFEYLLVQTENGPKIRKLNLKRNEKQKLQLIDFEKTSSQEKKANFLNHSVKLRLVQNIPPIYREKGAEANSALQVFFCIGRWIVESKRIQKNYVGTIKNSPCFTLEIKGNSALVTAFFEDVVFKTENEAEVVLEKGAPKEIDLSQLYKSAIVRKTNSWRFSPLQISSTAAVDVPKKEEEESTFKKVLTSMLLMLFLFSGILAILPEPEKEEELVPEKFAKVLLKPSPVQKEGNQPMAKGTAEDPDLSPSQAKAKATVQKTEIAKTFKSKTVQNSLQKLLKGGMSNLIKSKTLLSSNSNTLAKISNSKLSGTDQSISKDQVAGREGVEVGSFGGEGTGEAGGTGYGKGHKLGVEGQGSSFVSLDMGGSNVEEGLTKEEVGRVIHQHMSEVRYCYEASLIRNPAVAGKLVLDFTINSQGIVSTTSIQSSDLQDGRLDQCIVGRLKTWKFPKPKGGVSVGVSYPFIFKSLNR